MPNIAIGVDTGKSQHQAAVGCYPSAARSRWPLNWRASVTDSRDSSRAGCRPTRRRIWHDTVDDVLCGLSRRH
jgi:hypothetical protein